MYTYVSLNNHCRRIIIFVQDHLSACAIFDKLQPVFAVFALFACFLVIKVFPDCDEFSNSYALYFWKV